MNASGLFDLSGRTALVTGGSTGIGLHIAEDLGEMGARVAIVARKSAQLADAEAYLRSLGIDVHVFVGDAADWRQFTVATWGKSGFSVRRPGSGDVESDR